MKNIIMYVLLLLTMLVTLGCAEDEATSTPEKPEETEEVAADETTTEEEPETQEENKETEDPVPSQETTEKEKETTTASETPETETQPSSNEANKDLFSGYERIDVDGGDQSGDRASRVVVDIGYGDREYWAFTNEHGQLVKVVAEEIIPQDDASESVLSNGRYFWDEAKVPGVESDTLDEGHIIADSLGGVSNAYNITPQESTLNRHGDQAYLEDAIRNAGGATDFEAIITYPDTETQIPSTYQYTYTIQGNEIVDTFDNVNPDEVNASLGLTEDDASDSSPSSDAPSNAEEGDVSSVDANGNGQVTIQEAKDAGFSMPITSDHWLYPYMDDRDGDGTVGE